MPLIEVNSVTKNFGQLKALDDVNFEVRGGEAFAIAGESGSGKTTLARILLKLIPQTEGQILYSGGFSRRDYQMVFQNPYTSFNPRMRVKDILLEPLRLHRVRKNPLELLAEVELSGTFLEKYPHELSGGERQRLGIARAISIDPKFVLFDEPVSSLDMTVQLEILKLIKKLKERKSLTYVLIAHDLGVIKYMCDRVAVMKNGRIVEIGDVNSVFRDPQHSYTKLLLESIPRLSY